METSPIKKREESKIIPFDNGQENAPASKAPGVGRKAEVIGLEQGRVEVEQRKREKKNQREREIQEEYKDVFNFREERYAKDLLNSNLDKEGQKSISVVLKKHNGVVLSDGIDLIRDNKLVLEDEVAAIVAIIMHDSGKLSSHILSHHEKGVEYTSEMIEKMQKEGRKFEGIEITQELKQKILQAIDRHMNYDFLIRMNGGERFPEPENIVDKVVHDADMLANIGFKNVGFRLPSSEYMKEDLVEANNEENGKKKTNIIEETFVNVLKDAVKVDVFTPSAKKMAEKRIGDVEAIFDYLKKEKAFENILKDFIKISKVIGDDAENIEEDENILFVETLFPENKNGKEGGELKKNVDLIKKLLNDEIEKAGNELGIDRIIVDKLTI